LTYRNVSASVVEHYFIVPLFCAILILCSGNIYEVFVKILKQYFVDKISEICTFVKKWMVRCCRLTTSDWDKF